MKNAIVVVVIDNYPHARRTPTRASEGGRLPFCGASLGSRNEPQRPAWPRSR